VNNIENNSKVYAVVLCYVSLILIGSDPTISEDSKYF